MSSFRELREKIHSVQNIQKITQAMERVAAVHLRRAQKKAEGAAPYSKRMRKILDKLVAMNLDHPLFKARNVKKIGLVVITSDKGLCGTYNSNILSATDQFLKNYSPDAIQLIPVGKKAVEYYKRKIWQTAFAIPEWTEKITLEQIRAFSNRLVQNYVDGTFDEVWIIHTHYVSIVQRTVLVEKFLNIEISKSATPPKNLNYILEPCGPGVLADLLPRYCLTRIQQAFSEAYASELAARIVAMQTANRNSSDLIEDLTLVKNKLRQKEITREMIEISTGAEG